MGLMKRNEIKECIVIDGYLTESFIKQLVLFNNDNYANG